MHGSVAHASEITEINWSLKFSKIFFDAFKIEVDRVLQWQFLTILLRLQEHSKISVVKLLEDDEFKKFQESTGTRTKDHFLKGVLLVNFRDVHGSFLELPENQKKDRALTLNSHFHAATKSYVTQFIDLMSDGKIDWDIHSANEGQILRRFKALMDFQNNTYYPLWRKCIAELAGLASSDVLPKKEIIQELAARAPYWSLLLAVWKKHLGDTDVLTTGQGLGSAVVNTMRNADLTEVSECLKFLAGKNGPHILKAEKVNNVIMYSLIPKFELVLADYVSKIIAVRPQLFHQLQSIVDK